MRTIIDRFRGYTKQSLAWLLIWMGGLYQIGFAIPYEPMHQSVLYTTLDSIHPALPELWAVIGVIAMVMLLVGIALDNRIMVRVASTVQLVVWVFALVVYLKYGVALLALAIAATQMLFWAWNFTMREHENSLNS